MAGSERQPPAPRRLTCGISAPLFLGGGELNSNRPISCAMKKLIEFAGPYFSSLPASSIPAVVLSSEVQRGVIVSCVRRPKARVLSGTR